MQRTNKTILALMVVGILALTSFVVQQTVTKSSGPSEDYMTSEMNSSHDHDHSTFDPDEKYTPKKWKGLLPVSRGNFLFVEPDSITKPMQKNLVKLLQRTTIEDWDPDTGYVFDLLNLYVPKIGWNGFLTAADSIEMTVRNLPAWHRIGELIGEASNNHPKYAIELTARDSLNKAPLHGAVWYYVSKYENMNDTEAFFKYIKDNLCYFEKVDGMFSLWISCAHGVGHGLAQKFDNYLPAMQICAKNENVNFKYTCGTGIFMDLQAQETMHVVEPCNHTPLPASCFTFKSKYYRYAQKQGVENPCAGLDPYTKRGCVFGDGHDMSSDVYGAMDICGKYKPATYKPKSGEWRDYLACLSGVWQSKKVYKLDDPLAYCQEWKEYPDAHDMCIAHIEEFDFDSELPKWDWDLLENIP